MTQVSESVFNSLLNGKIPLTWAQNAYPTSKQSLSSFLSDLNYRAKFFIVKLFF
jgi:hypothetical protein